MNEEYLEAYLSDFLMQYLPKLIEGMAEIKNIV